jgi:uncharacterized protein YukE
MNLVGDPVTIRALASTLRRDAAHLDAVGRRVAQRATDCSWQSPRANRFRDQMAQDQRHSNEMAGKLVDIANQLDRAAAVVEAELQELHVLERAVRSLIGTFRPVAGLAAPWFGTGWSPGHLPSSGDPAWRACARALGVR